MAREPIPLLNLGWMVGLKLKRGLENLTPRYTLCGDLDIMTLEVEVQMRGLAQVH